MRDRKEDDEVIKSVLRVLGIDMMRIGRVSGGTGEYIPWAASPYTARRGREPPSHEVRS